MRRRNPIQGSLSRRGFLASCFGGAGALGIVCRPAKAHEEAPRPLGSIDLAMPESALVLDFDVRGLAVGVGSERGSWIPLEDDSGRVVAAVEKLKLLHIERLEDPTIGHVEAMLTPLELTGEVIADTRALGGACIRICTEIGLLDDQNEIIYAVRAKSAPKVYNYHAMPRSGWCEWSFSYKLTDYMPDPRPSRAYIVVGLTPADYPPPGR